MNFDLMAHDDFLQQMEEFMDTQPGALNSFWVQCKKACSDPFNSGGPLQGLPKGLSGRVKKLWAKGRKGFRFIFIVHASQKIILGVMITMESRANFDYDDPEWIERAIAIHDDFSNGRTEKFHRLVVP